MKNYRFHLTGAFGDPIDENPTCVMMNAAYEAAGVNFRYLNFLVKQGALEDALNGIRAMHFDGVNLTMPHKVEALQYVDELSPSVALIGSTNTIVNQGGRLIAHGLFKIPRPCREEFGGGHDGTAQERKINDFFDFF